LSFVGFGFSEASKSPYFSDTSTEHRTFDVTVQTFIMRSPSE
jgi:hypothetical protein